MAIDYVKLRELADEFGFWPATTDPEDIARHRRANAEYATRKAPIRSELSPADAALRERITELSVHIPCGGIRGPVYKSNPLRWQSCRHEDSPQRWEGCDVSRDHDLCVICARGTAGGASRWSWIACADCRAVNESLASGFGSRPFALGRHSVMNGVGVRGGVSEEQRERQLARLARFAEHHGNLWRWRDAEVARLAVAFDGEEDVALRVWQEHWPPGQPASWDAVTRMLGGAATR